MMPAAKHGDPQMGVDIHLCVVPPSPSPVPLPTPHTSIIFDPFDYVPILGATVTVCGMKRAVAGTSAKAIHIPPGFPFAPKIPDTSDEVFMGSATVVADGDPFSFLSVPVLSCQVAGMLSPPRLKQHEKKLMLLPTTVNIAIPTNVFIGGPPTISLMGMAFRFGFAALGKLAKSRAARALGERFRDWRKAKFGHLNPGFLKCTILRAEPVNIVSGAVTVEQEDFKICGSIPLRWTRRYTSNNPRLGACGVGWECPADARLEHDVPSGVVLFHHPEGGVAIFPEFPQSPGAAAATLELMDGARLSDEGPEFRVRTKEDRIYRFPKSLVREPEHDQREYPLGQIDDLCGNSLRYERSDGQLTALQERAGRRIELQHDRDGLVHKVQLHLPERGFQHTYVEYRYQDADLTEVRDALDNPYVFAYHKHLMLRHTDRNGLSFYYEYEGSGPGARVVRSWGDGDLYAYTFAYLDAANERKVTDSLGNVSLVKVDERGLPVSEIDPLGGTTIYGYDDAGRTILVEDQDGHRTEYDFDDSGNLLRLIRADGSAIVSEFDVDGRPIKTTDLNGGIWLQRWDSRGLMLEHSTPLGHVARYEYDVSGQLVAFTNARGHRSTVAFDALGNLTSLTDPRGYRSEFASDNLGNVTRKRDPLGNETYYRYDPQCRLVQARLPSGTTIDCAYDPEGNLIYYRDMTGAEARIEYVGIAEVARRVLPDGHSIRYRYDTEERLIAVTNQRGETYHLHRDALGRIVAETDYWGQTRRFRYTGCGHLAESSDPLGRTIQYQTDPLGRVLRKVVSPSMLAPAGQPEGEHDETFEYDNNGNIIACANAAVRITRTFDLQGQLLAERQGLGCIVSNTYDANGNRITRTTSRALGGERHNTAVHYAYDANDQVVRVEIEGQAPIEVVRDPIGRPTEERLGRLVRRSLEYTADGYPTAQRVAAGGQPLFDLEYRYDAGGNPVERRDSTYGVDRYTYDPVGRLTANLNPEGRLTHFLNDAAGDRLNAPAPGPAREQDSEWRRDCEYDGTYYRFDRAGNLVLRAGALGELQLDWDAYQRLSRTAAQGMTTTYQYDPLGRRIRKQNDDTTVHFCWDGDLLLGDAVVPTSSDGEDLPHQLREWVAYPDSYEPLAMIRSADAPAQSAAGPQVHYYQNDPNGCPTRLLDVTGRVVWAALHGGWGRIEKLLLNEVDNPIRLQGQYEDYETGLYYNRYRYYDAGAGHYISLDPIGLQGGLQLYISVPNILSWIDPLGLDCNLPKALKKQFRKIEELAATPGNRGIRAALSPRELRKLGEEFVGEGYTITRGARHGELWLVSADGKRMFRSPTPKASEFARTGKQANFHQRNNIRSDWFDDGAVSNVHVHSH